MKSAHVQFIAVGSRIWCQRKEEVGAILPCPANRHVACKQNVQPYFGAELCVVFPFVMSLRHQQVHSLSGEFVSGQVSNRARIEHESTDFEDSQ